MRVLVAGATGVLGKRLLPQLIAGGHDVVGIARKESGAATLRERGADAIVADVMDRDALLRAVETVRADAVIHELTALKRPPTTFGAMRETNRLRVDGTSHLIEAAAAVGATRFITQSIVFGYGYIDHGPERLTEKSAFGLLHGDRTDEPIGALLSTEQQAFAVGGIALSYGLFYGEDVPSMKGMLDRRSLPVPSRWRGAIPFVHHADAASATVAALERGVPGRAYNVVDDDELSWAGFVGTVADATGAARPLRLPDGLLRVVAPYAGVMMTRLNMRVSNALAKDELGWSPAYPTVADGVAASS